MSQQVKLIKVSDLVLWTENPRDPIDETASVQDVVNRAIADPNSKWSLDKLAHEMGEYYDYSELPIVVDKGGHPVVYDGNRRVVLAKIKLGCVKVEGFNAVLPDVDDEIPCNVCSEDIALKSVYRKHVTLGNSWNALERDIFVARFMHGAKSNFLLLDENTGGFISRNPVMNQGFVRDEVLTDSILAEMGFGFKDGKMQTKHSDEEVATLLNDLLEKIQTKQITTRVNRGKPIQALDQRSKDIISANKDKSLHDYVSSARIEYKPKEKPAPAKQERKTPITRKANQQLFGETLMLKSGDVNNLYSDLLKFYEYQLSGEAAFSPSVMAFFRMGIRLICETAAKERGYTDIKDYIKKYYPEAKKTMSQDTKTMLSGFNVSQETLPQLLHTGAHNYTSSTSRDQAMAISIAVGAMLRLSHGK